MSLTMTTPYVLKDPGFLFSADLASSLPAMVAAGSNYNDDIWPVAWKPWGATEDGSQFSYEMTVEPITVAELFNAIEYAPTGVTTSLAFASTDFTLNNLARSMNAPSSNISTVSGSAATLSSKLSPPTPSQIKYRMIGWESLDHTLRFVGYQCLQGGQIQASFQKAPNKAAIAMTWNITQPAIGDPFNFWAAGVGRLGS
ncbi:hypothetical protein [Actinoplanes sp. N902-109]|uniref:hypothetical protein n=1 Tax=Actinoplanes sp. (strain N902-109) TaxID=649831 RepID=UPI0003294965|nr:hypothetical protein [Actinoplanes sp. N902-109]AGL19500.1 hypothetical protein L083_5990 [Actinoplanes sp. N902-109]